MSRPRLDIGTFGVIMTRKVAPGRVEARARYRDWDGTKRLVQATADTAAAATRKLRVKLAARDLLQPTHVGLSRDSLFADLADYWLDDLRTEGRLSKTTMQLYERDMRSLVLPSFTNLMLREIGVARCDHFITQLSKQSYSKAKHARVVLRLAFGLAVRHEILSRNPVDHVNVARLHRIAPIPDALTPHEVNEIREAIALWEAVSRGLQAEAGRTAWRDHRGDARYLVQDRGGTRDPALRHRPRGAGRRRSASAARSCRTGASR